MKTYHYDLIVVGAGAAGIMAAITAARNGKKALLLEKLSNIAAKLKATGGGRCNLTNTLSNEEFMSRFGRDGRFMQDALKKFDHNELVKFFADIGVETHAPDGFRIFPTTHSSATILNALNSEMKKLTINVLTSHKVNKILTNNEHTIGVETDKGSFFANNVIVATGGLGYPTLGAEGDGYSMAKNLGHKITSLHPAMMPLHTKEKFDKCRADTIPKVEIRVAMPKHKKIKAFGDLIFTKNGIRGPVVLDFAREITPLIDKYKEVPMIVNLTKGKNEDDILKHLKKEAQNNTNANIGELISTLLPNALSKEICYLSDVDPESKFNKINGVQKNLLIKNLAWTPMTITGHDGFKMAMITRGGISLKEINPKTMQSKIVDGLYFCGEVMDIDGPCGGYNLQWSFSSGTLAGNLLK